jgi:hypothetical protein
LTTKADANGSTEAKPGATLSAVFLFVVAGVSVLVIGLAVLATVLVFLAHS